MLHFFQTSQTFQTCRHRVFTFSNLKYLQYWKEATKLHYKKGIFRWAKFPKNFLAKVRTQSHLLVFDACTVQPYFLKLKRQIGHIWRRKIFKFVRIFKNTLTKNPTRRISFANMKCYPICMHNFSATPKFPAHFVEKWNIWVSGGGGEKGDISSYSKRLVIF